MNAIPVAESIRRLVFTAALAGMLAVAATAARAGYEEGAVAFNNQDYATAMKELRPLAERKDPQSQYIVGLMHQYGLGVPEDFEKAAFWLRGAVQKGNASANLQLGLLYYYGKGVAEDHEQAAALFTTAADAGIALAMFYAGEVYEDIPQRFRKMRSDSQKSYFYYTLADEYLTAAGDVEVAETARIRVGLLKMFMTSDSLKAVDRDLAKWRKAHQ